MARGYTAGRYLEIAHQLRERIPGVQLGADIIVGFPGETEEEFEATYRLMEEVRFSQAFLFRYSPRPGTPAFGRLEDDVPEVEKRRRLARLLELQTGLQEARHTALIGSRQEVLVEGRSRRNDQVLFGRNLAFDRIVFPGDPAWTDTLVEVDVREATALTLTGERAPTAEPV
jgi:tRNA-2-methylthio-N6-dimethylallyladenosine synthase